MIEQSGRIVYGSGPRGYSGYPSSGLRVNSQLGAPVRPIVSEVFGSRASLIRAGYLIMKLTSNTILITGGGSGLGYEIPKKLTALGKKILITGPDQSNMDREKAAFPKMPTFRI